MCHYSYHGYFILSHTLEKSVTERNKTLSLWGVFINWGTQPVLDCCWLNDWKWLMAGPIFLSNGEVLDCFSQPVLLKLIKITDMSKVSKTTRVGSIQTCPKLAKWLSILNCSKLAKWSVWKFIYFQSWRS